MIGATSIIVVVITAIIAGVGAPQYRTYSK